MQSNRLKKIGGIYKEKDFNKLIKQLNNRAVLVVTVINSNCEECAKHILIFIEKLKKGYIDKMTQVVMVYGFNHTPLGETDDNFAESDAKKEGEKKKKLSDSRVLSWEKLPSGHGYCIFHDENDMICYDGEFEHREYADNIVDNVRRFKSSIRSLSDLAAKRRFIENKRSGIIVGTNSSTQRSQVIDLENKIQSYGDRIKIPIYFCKSVAQEMELVVKGDVKYKQKGLVFEKFIKKVPKFL